MSKETQNPVIKKEENIYGTDIKNKEDKFNITEFNKQFEDIKKQSKKRIKQMEKDRVNDLEANNKQKYVYQLSIAEILIGIKDTWFDIIDDILQKNFTSTFFTKNNRLFFIGLTIVIIVLFIYIIDTFVGSDTSSSDNTNKIEIVYKFDNQNTLPNLPNLPIVPNLKDISNL